MILIAGSKASLAKRRASRLRLSGPVYGLCACLTFSALMMMMMILMMILMFNGGWADSGVCGGKK